MHYRKIVYLLPFLSLFTAAASAATPEEMKQLDALERPGKVSICEAEGILQAGDVSMKFGEWARGTVISMSGEQLRYHVERSSSVDGDVYTRYEYEMTSRLENDVQVFEIDPKTVRVTFPENTAEAAEMANLIRDNNIERQSFKDVHITTFPFYEIDPAPDDPMHMRTHCGPESSAE